jgi:DNA (cytosine-5)-methyltransferase 1
VKRHRLFESNVPLTPTTCPKGHPGNWLLVFGRTVLTRGKTVGYTKGGKFANIHREHVGTERGRRAMGIDWMTRDELSEAIPPAYTKFIGEQILKALA